MIKMSIDSLMSLDKIKNKPAISSLKLAELLNVPHFEVLNESRKLIVQERWYVFDYSAIFTGENGRDASALIVPSRIAKSVAMRVSGGKPIGPRTVKTIRGREKSFLMALNKQDLIEFIETYCLAFD